MNLLKFLFCLFLNSIICVAFLCASEAVDKNMEQMNTPPRTPQPMGPSNTYTVCTNCQTTVNTAVEYTSTSRTHILAVLCCLICCCCCIPYCMDSAKNTDHYCPQCKKFLGTYQK